MKKLTFFLIAALIATLIVCIVLFQEWRSTVAEYNNLSDRHQIALSRSNDTITVIKTIRDTVANTTTTVYNPIQTNGEIQGYVSKGIVDTMAMALNVAAKKIDKLESMLITIEGKGKGERRVDTVTKTQWLVLKNDPTFDVKVNLSNDSIYPSTRVRLTQAYAPYRRNIFSRYEYRSAIMASDSRVRISEVIDVNRVPRSPRWSIGFFGGPLVTHLGFSYGVGFGLTYDLIQFKK